MPLLYNLELNGPENDKRYILYFEKAVNLYDNILSFPHEWLAEIYSRIGYFYYLNRNYKKAVENLSKAGENVLQLGNYDGLIDVSSIAKDWISSLSKLGNCSMAENILKRFLNFELHRDCNEQEYIYDVAGEFYLSIEKYSKAKKIYKQWIEINNKSYSAKYGLAISYHMLKDYDRALILWESLINEEKDKNTLSISEYMIYKAEILVNKKLYGDALGLVTEAISTIANVAIEWKNAIYDLPSALVFQGQLYEALKKTIHAKNSYENAFVIAQNTYSSPKDYKNILIEFYKKNSILFDLSKPLKKELVYRKSEKLFLQNILMYNE